MKMIDNEIVIHVNEVDESMTLAIDDELVKEGDWMVLDILMQAYLNEARRVITEHKTVCDDPECRLVPFHRGIVASIASWVNMEQLSHTKKKDDEEEDED